MEQGLADPMSGTTSLGLKGDKATVGARRKELAAFLRTRRQSLSPEERGLPLTRRRRVKGLRREEVAELAGISVAWYTWIEQVRDLNLSAETLHSISRALRLTSREAEHLFTLAGHTLLVPQMEEHHEVMSSIQQLLDAMAPNPAYALDTHWNIVAWNDGAEALFGDLRLSPERERNFVWLTFSGPFHGLFVNWEEVARCVVAHFRADSVGHIGEPFWQGLVHELQQESKEFRDWWPQQQVDWPMSWQKKVFHPMGGEQTFKTFDLELFRPARLRIVTYIPDHPHPAALCKS